MSMFNDIIWKKHDQNCISNAEQVKDYVMKFKPGHWTFWVQDRKRDGAATLTMDSGIAKTTGWYSNSKKQVIPSS